MFSSGSRHVLLIATAISLLGCQSSQLNADSDDVFQALVEAHKQYGATPETWPAHEFQTTQIQPDVIIAPTYSPKLFEPYVKNVSQIADGRFPVFEIETKQGRKISFIHVGVGACNTLDAVLALSATPCRKILFIGSVGSLSADAGIGDIIVPSESVSGCEADLYITTNSFLKSNTIGQGYSSDADSSATLRNCAQKFTKDDIKVVDKKVFSIDTVIGEYRFISEMQKLGCGAVEMETATLFHAAKVINRKATALLYIVDCTLEGQSIYHGRTKASDIRKQNTKKKILPQIAIEFFEQ